MSWPKQKPLNWEWFQDEISSKAVAKTCARLAKAKQVIKYIIPLPQGDVLIVSCKGTPKAKRKPTPVDLTATREAEAAVEQKGEAMS